MTPSLPGNDLPDQLAGFANWVQIARRDKTAELDQIDPSFTGFYLRDPAMGNVEATSQVSLGKTSPLASSAQLRPQKGILRGVDRLFHCSHYRSKLECSQNRYKWHGFLRGHSR